MPQIQFELDDITLDNNELVFCQKASFGDFESDLYFFGKLMGDKINGRFESERGDILVEGTRIKNPPSPVGDWDVQVKFIDTIFEEKMEISRDENGRLTGKWMSQLPEDEITDLKFDGNKLNFVRKSRTYDGVMKFEFEGMVIDDILIGQFTSGVSKIDVTGNRKVIPLQGEWEIVTAASSGERTSILTVNDDMTAVYRLGGVDVPVKNLDYEYGQLTFTVDLSFGEIVFRMDFAGHVSDKKIEGQFTTPRGIRKVTGKKIDTKDQCEQQCSLPMANNPGLEKQVGQCCVCSEL